MRVYSFAAITKSNHPNHRSSGFRTSSNPCSDRMASRMIPWLHTGQGRLLAIIFPVSSRCAARIPPCRLPYVVSRLASSFAAMPRAWRPGARHRDAGRLAGVRLYAPYETAARCACLRADCVGDLSACDTLASRAARDCNVYAMRNSCHAPRESGILKLAPRNWRKGVDFGQRTTATGTAQALTNAVNRDPKDTRPTESSWGSPRPSLLVQGEPKVRPYGRIALVPVAARRHHTA